MSLGKTSTQESAQQIDPMLRREAVNNTNLVRALASMGFNPYEGNTTAAVQPATLAAMDMSNSFADAFGFEGAAGEGMPEATDDGSGVLGYSAFDGMKEAMGEGYDDFRAKLDNWFKKAGKKTKFQEQPSVSGGKK